MSAAKRVRPAREDVPCEIEIERTWETLHAHVHYKRDVEIAEGDEVQVLGEKIHVPFGQRLRLQRTARIKHAGPLTRLWTRITAFGELMELLEFSFTSRRKL
ncbi:hypothetical protein [Rhodovibrio salinarum]|uniref:Uncharacterized protein n=1 Tax=Rhodovibrio salinarum TaxID=1087 RepID=A0A934QKZ7_9PROT|nr:hypothetical protein [Rhodovibrio salinarum]MBK1698856.1 hypothetical protein [Rhodovibrio salinarum]